MADDDTPKKKKGGAFKWIVLLLLILLIAGGGAAWYYLFSGLPGSRGAAQTTGQTQVLPAASTPVSNLTTAELPTFMVNLADPLGRRYIRLTVEVEMASPEVADELTAQMPKIRDAVIMLLSGKSYADLMPTESKIVLKDEIAARLNQALGGPKITRVFFTDLVIQ